MRCAGSYRRGARRGGGFIRRFEVPGADAEARPSNQRKLCEAFGVPPVELLAALRATHEAAGKELAVA